MVSSASRNNVLMCGPTSVGSLVPQVCVSTQRICFIEIVPANASALCATSSQEMGRLTSLYVERAIEIAKAGGDENLEKVGVF